MQFKDTVFLAKLVTTSSHWLIIVFFMCSVTKLSVVTLLALQFLVIRCGCQLWTEMWTKSGFLNKWNMRLTPLLNMPVVWEPWWRGKEKLLPPLYRLALPLFFLSFTWPHFCFFPTWQANIQNVLSSSPSSFSPSSPVSSSFSPSSFSPPFSSFLPFSPSSSPTPSS